MESNLQTQKHCVIPTERSDEGSLASARDDKQTTNPSYTALLRETQQEEFPLLSEVTSGTVDDPLTLMNAHTDDDGVVVPCALPDAMVQPLPQMMSETLSLYDDADIKTMLLMAMMPTIGSTMSNVRVRHGQRLYSLGMMNICVGPSASGKGSVGEEFGLKQNGIAKKLARLTKEFYIAKVRQGVFVKTSKTERERWKKECTLLAA